MRRWLKQVRLELRLLLRNPFYAALPVLFTLLYGVIVLELSSESASSFYSSMYNFTSIAHTITLGPAMLIGILAVRRDIRKPSFEWNRVLPVSFHLLLSAKYVVAQLYMLLFTLSAAVIFYSRLVSTGAHENYAIRYVGNLALQFEISYLVTVALAMLLAVSIPNRAVYLIGFCGWMFGTFFMELFLIDQAGLSFLKTFHLSQLFVNDSLAGYENWGYELIKPELWKSWRFVLAFTLLLLLTSLLLLNRLRPTMHQRWCWMLTVSAAILAAGALVPYASLHWERSQHHARLMADPAVRSIDLPPRPWDAGLSVSSYDISLVREENDMLRFQVKMTVPPSSYKGRNAFPMTLNRIFKVEGILVQGSDAEFRQQGDRLSIRIPPEMKGNMQIEVWYSGTILEYARQYQNEIYTFFSVGQEVHLPKHMAWYPLAGVQDIYLKREDADTIHWNTYSRQYPPADMKLTVEGYSLPVYAGIQEVESKPSYQRFEGNEVRGLSLYSSRDWIELKSEKIPITVITSPLSERYVRGMLDEVEKKYAYFEEWIPELGNKKIQILHARNKYPDRILETSNRLIISNGIYYNHSQEFSSLPGEWMNAILFGNQAGYGQYGGSTKAKVDVRDRISSLFWYMYYRQEQGLSDRELVQNYNWTRSVSLLLYKNNDDDPTGIGRKMSAQVSHALRRGQEREVREVLLYFYRKGLTLPTEEENLFIREQPIPYSEWLQKWEEIVGTPSKG